MSDYYFPPAVQELAAMATDEGYRLAKPYVVTGLNIRTNQFETYAFPADTPVKTLFCDCSGQLSGFVGDCPVHLLSPDQWTKDARGEATDASRD